MDIYIDQLDIQIQRVNGRENLLDTYIIWLTCYVFFFQFYFILF